MCRPVFALFLTFSYSAIAGEASFFGRTFTFPDGYTLTVAAAPELIERPIEASFDDKGRLYVSESSGSNEPVAAQLEKKPHKLWRLEDADGDGVFEKRTLFADQLMFPEGVLWHGGSVYVSAPPQIWKFTDTDDDGVSDHREIWHDGGTLTGCANDLHGPYAGPDGLLYWTKGAFAEQTVDLPGRPGFKSTAAHVWRAKPDGSEKEIVFTAGMDNPVGLEWTPEGDMIVSGTFLQNPGGGRRDGLIHAVHGGVWGKDHGVLDGHIRTGPLLPAMTHMGPAAPAGIHRYGRDLLVCQFNMRKVSRHSLHPEGGTWRTEDSDFLSSDHPDFHPTDVLQAPDGSVLIIDTGGWYKLCCPTSQLAKPEVSGAIYRLRRKAGEVPVTCPPPRWKLEQPDDLAALRRDLKSPNLHLRRKAAEALAVLTNRTPLPVTPNLGILSAPARAATAALLEAAAQPDNDRFTEHSIIYAAIEAADGRTMRAALAGSLPALQRLGLYFVSQTDLDLIGPEHAMRLLASPDESVREAAVFALKSVAAWRPAAVEVIRRELRTETGPSRMRQAIKAAQNAELLDELAVFLTDSETPAARESLLELMQEIAEEEKAVRPAWLATLLQTVEHGEQPAIVSRAAAVLAAGTGKGESPAERLLILSRKPGLAPEVRLQLLSGARSGKPAPEDLDALLNMAAKADRRPEIFALLRTHPLAPEQLRRAAALLADCSLLERPLLLPVFKTCNDEVTGMALLETLEKEAALRAVPEDVLTASFAGFPDTVKQRLAKAKAALSTGTEEQQARVEALLKSLPPGDAARGSLVFQSAKASCVQCHQIGYKGGTLGPDLSRTGAIRTRRDLIEAVVAPSVSFVRSYEPVMVMRTEGDPVYGIVIGQSTGSVTLSTGAAIPPVTLKQTEVASMTPGEISLMPAGLDQILTAEEFADLIAFLESMK